MQLKELVGKNRTTILNAVAFQKLHLLSGSAKQTDEMVAILESTPDRELIKGLTIITNVLACAVTQTDSPTALYKNLRQSLNENPNHPAAAAEKEILDLLDASEEETSARYHLLLNLASDPVRMVGGFLVLNATLLNNAIWQGSPQEILVWLHEIFMEDDISGA